MCPDHLKLSYIFATLFSCRNEITWHCFYCFSYCTKLFAGVLRIEDLKGLIFKGRRFSSDHVKKYIELMNKFEVALQISNNYLLVPSLLPIKQGPSPAVSSSLSEETRVSMKMEAYRNSSVFRRQYRMSYVPSGFWARLVTRYDYQVSFFVKYLSC